jgi:hypothetical protein
MNAELERLWKEPVVAYICPEGLRKPTKSPSVAGVRAEIRTDYFPNTSPELYRCANPLV